MSHSTCRTCGESKSKDQFPRNSYKDYRRLDCKSCFSLKSVAQRRGVTVAFVNQLAKDQDHRCAICHQHQDDVARSTDTHSSLVIDHDHATGKVRGLLCHHCNLVLGRAKDNVQTLAQAIAYLTT